MTVQPSINQGRHRVTGYLARHETDAKRQSLNSEPGCIKVVDTFRSARIGTPSSVEQKLSHCPTSPSGQGAV